MTDDSYVTMAEADEILAEINAMMERTPVMVDLIHGRASLALPDGAFDDPEFERSLQSVRDILGIDPSVPNAHLRVDYSRIVAPLYRAPAQHPSVERIEDNVLHVAFGRKT